MSLILASPVHDKVAPEVAKLRDRLSERLTLRWVSGSKFWFQLGLLDEAAVDAHGEAVRIAIDKAANAHQGFTVTLRGVGPERAHAGGHAIVLRVAEKAGMLGALMTSFVDRVGSQVPLTHNDPWRPLLVLAQSDRALPERDALQLESAAFGNEWRCGVKELALLRPSDGSVLHSGTLPSSGG